MNKQLFERFDGHQVTDHMLKEASVLFSENYGIWGTDPTGSGPVPKPGELPLKPFLYPCASNNPA